MRGNANVLCSRSGDRTENETGLNFEESYGLTTVKRPYPRAPVT